MAILGIFPTFLKVSSTFFTCFYFKCFKVKLHGVITGYCDFLAQQKVKMALLKVKR